jgi:hypothetical protein
LLSDQPPMVSNNDVILTQPKSDENTRYHQSYASSSEKIPSTHDVGRFPREESQRHGTDCERKTGDRVIAHLDLQLSKSETSSAYGSKSALSALSAASPSRYGRPPTPEEIGHRSQLRQMEPTATGDVMSEEFQIQQQLEQLEDDEKENSNVVGPDVGSNSINFGNDAVQSSVIGRNGMFLQTHLSPKKTKKAHHQKRESHIIVDEKKEDQLLSTMASDEDWLDDVVSFALPILDFVESVHLKLTNFNNTFLVGKANRNPET